MRFRLLTGLPLLMPSLNQRWIERALLLLALALALGSGPVFANGRATLISSQEKGPYRIDVSILPGQAVVGNTHISVLVFSLANQEPLTQATVEVSGVGPAGGTDFGPLPAPNSYTPQFYETNLPFDLEGEWTVTVHVVSELGEESVQVPMSVRPGGLTINLIWVLAAMVATLAVGLWTWDRLRGRRRKTGAEE